jgi:intracellular sulfur oxidation DsrE/DsrF family protein
MTRTIRIARVTFATLTAVATLLPAAAAAQGAEAVIRQHGSQPSIPDPSFPATPELVYRVSWDVNVGAEKAGDIVPGFRRPAGFLVSTDANDVPRKNVHLAIIVYGTATQSLLTTEAYRAATGSDNQNVALLQALHDSGVQIIVCGEALVNRNVPRAQLLPFVKVATNATLARATLAAQGYATFH